VDFRPVWVAKKKALFNKLASSNRASNNNKEKPPLAYEPSYYKTPSPSNASEFLLDKEKAVDNYVTTCDLYEGAYYLTKGCELVSIAGRRVNGKVACELTFSKPGIVELQITYFKGGAEVNLLSFRRVFGHIHALVHREKKRCQNILKNGGTL
jgi:hypothetical protein